MLHISARLDNDNSALIATVTTNENAQSLALPAKPAGTGSAISGDELLLLALATCYCNDIYREAAQRDLIVTDVQVQVTGEFDSKPGSPAEKITYSASVSAQAGEDAILELMYHTDTVAEIHNTLRKGMTVQLVSPVAISIEAIDMHTGEQGTNPRQQP